MSRKRNPENRGLPLRWARLKGAYYYRVPPGLESAWDGRRLFRLGSSMAEAARAWADRVDAPMHVRNVQALLDRYLAEVVPTKAPTTQQGNRIAVERLARVFGAMPLDSIKPRHVYQYADKRTAKVAAHRELEVLSHAYTKAVEWGLLDQHPFIGQVRLAGEKPRTRYLEDWEVDAMLALPAARKAGSVLAVQAYIRLKLLTGLRRGDLLSLRVADCQADGLHVTTGKTNKSVIFTWTPALRQAVADARAARPVDIAPHLFCTRTGAPYIDGEKFAPGWKSIWQRFQARVMAETAITEKFTEHDIRAKVGSDADGLERARELLTHASTATTARAYRRKADRVAPAK